MSEKKRREIKCVCLLYVRPSPAAVGAVCSWHPWSRGFVPVRPLCRYSVRLHPVPNYTPAILPWDQLSVDTHTHTLLCFSYAVMLRKTRADVKIFSEFLSICHTNLSVWLQKTEYFTWVIWTAFMVPLSPFLSLKAFNPWRKDGIQVCIDMRVDSNWLNFYFGVNCPFTYYWTHLL